MDRFTFDTDDLCNLISVATAAFRDCCCNSCHVDAQQMRESVQQQQQLVQVQVSMQDVRCLNSPRRAQGPTKFSDNLFESGNDLTRHRVTTHLDQPDATSTSQCVRSTGICVIWVSGAHEGGGANESGIS